MSYEKFAAFYDGLTGNVRYDEYAKYLRDIFDKFSPEGGTVLDAACGTGNITCRLSDMGYEMIGVDSSPEMLGAAKEKSGERDILYLCQDLEELDLYGTVDKAVCTLDSLNHMESIEKIEEIFRRISLFMNRDGVFVFDMNSLYKHEKVLGDNTFIYDNDEVYCVWQNFFNENDKSIDIELDFFAPEGRGKYERYFESFSEYYYSPEEIMKLLDKSSFKTEGIFEFLTFNPPGDKTERIIFVARKI